MESQPYEPEARDASGRRTSPRLGVVHTQACRLRGTWETQQSAYDQTYRLVGSCPVRCEISSFRYSPSVSSCNVNASISPIRKAVVSIEAAPKVDVLPSA